MLFSACDSVLDVTPKQSIDSREALESPEAIQAAINSVYAYLRQTSQYGRDLVAIPELLADNTEHTNNPTALYGQYRNQPGAHMGIWGSSYAAINEINNILHVLEEPPVGVSEEFEETIAGQAYFLRALYYHNLSRIYGYDPKSRIDEVDYGSVPLLVEPVLGTDQVTYPSRADIEQIYELIYDDLEMAFNLLEGKTVDGSDPEYYGSAAAAASLFSRVALYNEDFERVITEADKALELSGGRFMGHDNYIAGWRQMKLPESIFEVVFHLGDHSNPVNESLRVTFTSRQTLSSTSFSNRGNVVVGDELYELYPADDVRRGLFMNGLGRNANRTEITKFLSRSAINHDNVPVIRVSEVYLNRAEAYARSGMDEQARQDVNRIRERAGLNPVPETLSGQGLIDEILLQRRLELAFEGHRFFDLKRLGMDIIKPIGDVRFDEYRILAPIPYSEVERNGNLQQNFGY
ncbi:RagB/SusD family nutrient uptake outer membrane protein [Sinomicrobium soli]|nr:RagB/SusD family nutrient uptake outer membrane protein [Sinomicrobium sp. N-1-3-6]